MDKVLSAIDAVIFDMDGVLIDSEPLWQVAEQDIFSALGAAIKKEHTDVTRFMTTTAVAKYWFSHYPWEAVSLLEAEQMVVDRVKALITVEDCLIPDVEPFISRLKEMGLKIGLATNSPAEIIPVVLEKVKIRHLFDAVASADFEENGKPHPAVYLTAAHKLNVHPERCLAIEDSHTGATAAKRAGMKVAAFTNEQDMQPFDFADILIDSFGSVRFEGI